MREKFGLCSVGLVMSGHAGRMCKSAYHHLRCIRKISMTAFSVVGPTMWNELITHELRECTSVDVFKERLKTHLVHLHY